LREVTWEDASGKKHKSLIRDNDPDDVAIEGKGLSQDPPDIESINWEDVKRDLHNQLFNRGLITKNDVMKQQNGITGAILAALKRRVLDLYGGQT
jgi:hypothetical protein